ncbi:hypothetical protein [Janthinobacterium sp. B9-8]|uniref:hypothetical protein n=1 Tax=Janthinobacterium sp. B9-8 TaxID=1236179 RepID=UPI00061D28CE|nr:hypothetical protein [Janthinobacterium sp. B9-8]AMC34549.1 hypothetical protein VN23_08005 [Janthinobacterium sp. B9-8]
MSDLPVPSETGASGTQVAGSSEPLSVDPNPPIHGLPITQTMEVLAATRARSFGGEVAASLIAGSFTQMSHDLEVTRCDLRIRDEQLQKTHQELGDAKVTIATLRERVGAISRAQHLKQLSVFVGTAILGVAVDLYKNNIEKPSYLLGIVGVVLLLATWLTKREGADE